jgi:hypothetical protein
VKEMGIKPTPPDATSTLSAGGKLPSTEAAISDFAPRPAPQLVFVKSDKAQLGAPDLGPEVLSRNAQGADAIVLILSNAGAPIRRVIAEVIFRDGEHEVCGGTGTWVGRFQNSVDFEPVQRHELVIALRGLNRRAYAVMNRRQNALPTRTNRAFIRALETAAPFEYYLLPEKPLEVRVSLLDSEGRSLMPTALFSFTDTGDGFALEKCG